MEQRESDIKLGRFLRLVLRHHPEAAGALITIACEMEPDIRRWEGLGYTNAEIANA